MLPFRHVVWRFQSASVLTPESRPRTHLALCLAVALTSSPVQQAAAAAQEELEFSDGFLIGGSAIDMARYARGNPLHPGDYSVDLWVNEEFVASRDVTFVGTEDGHSASACISPEFLHSLSLKPDYRALFAAQNGQCLDLPALIDGASVIFNSNTLRLDISVPQVALARHARGYVAPQERDAGITAGFLNYSANHYRSNGRQHSYLGVNTGLNVGAWRLRHRASFSERAAGYRHNVISSHLQRDLPAWNSQLWLGQGTTGGDLFDAVAFTGVRMATDERMLPDSLRGYAPVVQGIAEGNAVVRIHQNGTLIHEVSVAPGPFSIEDLYPTSFGGDLQVTVTEADGREQRFNVNFSAVPQALRAGSVRFSATAGALRNGQGAVRPLRFAEATVARGISNGLTVLGGVQLGEDYRAVLGGAAVNTAFGAFGADVTHASARARPGQQSVGHSLRLNYQRYVASTGTNVGLAAYRYSTRGFMTLGDTARAQQDAWRYGSRARQRYQLNFSQRLGERSAVHLSGGHVSYWNSARRQNDYQLGVQSMRGRVNYGLAALRYRVGDGRQDTRYTFTLSVPLGRGTHAPRLSSQLGHSAGGGQGQLGLNGTLGAHDTLSYSLAASAARAGTPTQSSYLAYQGSHLNANAGYSRSGDSRSRTLGAAGSVVLHPGGINFGQPAGESVVLVQAPGAEGAHVGNGHDIRIASNGYALLPHVSPYRWNRIDLDPSGLPLDVELLQTSLRVAPTAGSIARVPFAVRIARTLFIDATDALGQPLPFAARVEDDSGHTLGAVGQGSVIQLRGEASEGVLIVDPDGPQRCRLQYHLPDAADAYGLSWTQATCMPQPLRSQTLQAAATPLTLSAGDSR